VALLKLKLRASHPAKLPMQISGERISSVMHPGTPPDSRCLPRGRIVSAAVVFRAFRFVRETEYNARRQ
jgi:hypothetical protein